MTTPNRYTAIHRCALRLSLDILLRDPNEVTLRFQEMTYHLYTLDLICDQIIAAGEVTP